jgi:predicted DCC family thiol-disulfide oxidoreductase YuxK
MQNESIIFFDGVCNFCNSSINFLMKIDKNRKLKFAALQSDFSKQKLLPFQKELQSVNSIVFLKDDKVFIESNAVANFLIEIGGFWKIIGNIIQLTPNFISNFFYKLIAKYRYKIFGKRNVCRVPNENEKQFFLE